MRPATSPPPSEVVARGYDKFFNVGQTPGPASLEEVVRAGVGRPLTVRRKWNGYLAIVSVIDGRLRVLSKSGVTPFSEHASSLLAAHLGERAGELAEIISGAGASLTFEVISRRDPHIIDEGDDKVILLDAIRNQEDMVLLDGLRRDLAERRKPIRVLVPRGLRLTHEEPAQMRRWTAQGCRLVGRAQCEATVAEHIGSVAVPGNRADGIG